jgi:hypothetical protein
MQRGKHQLPRLGRMQRHLRRFAVANPVRILPPSVRELASHRCRELAVRY